MSATVVTLLDARWRLHVAEDREASHQVRCRAGCKPGASTCLTGRALTAEVVEAMSAHDWRCECGDLNRWHEVFCYRCGGGQPECQTCADRGTVQGRPCIDCGTDA